MQLRPYGRFCFSCCYLRIFSKPQLLLMRSRHYVSLLKRSIVHGSGSLKLFGGHMAHCVEVRQALSHGSRTIPSLLQTYVLAQCMIWKVSKADPSSRKYKRKLEQQGATRGCETEARMSCFETVKKMFYQEILIKNITLKYSGLW